MMKENMKKATFGNLKTLRTLSTSLGNLLRAYGVDDGCNHDAILKMAQGIVDVATSTEEIIRKEL